MITKDISLLPHKAIFILIEYPAACCMGALFDDINRPKYFKYFRIQLKSQLSIYAISINSFQECSKKFSEALLLLIPQLQSHVKGHAGIIGLPKSVQGFTSSPPGIAEYGIDFYSPVVGL